LQRRLLVGWVIIILGALILLHQLNLFSFNRAASLALASLFLGLVLFIRGLSHPLHKGILSGSFFIFLGLAIGAMRLQLIFPNDSIAIAAILISLGLAHLVYFIVVKTQLSNLIFGLVMIACGGVLLLYAYDFLSYWDLRAIARQYWPVLIILTGLGILIDGIIKKWMIKKQKTI
jgi:hypothetical protein